MNGYFRFQCDPEVKAMVLKLHPDGKLLKSKFGELWRGMSEKEKEPYVSAYEHDKEAYDKLYEDYVAVHGKETREKKKKDESKSKSKSKGRGKK
jgi:hypothetical protein